MNLEQARTISEVFASKLSRLVPGQEVEVREDIAEDLTTEPHVIILPIRRNIEGAETAYLVRAFFMGEMLSSVGRLYAVPTLLEIMADNVRAELIKIAAVA